MTRSNHNVARAGGGLLGRARVPVVAALAALMLASLVSSCSSTSLQTSAEAKRAADTKRARVTPRPITPGCIWGDDLNVQTHNQGYLDSRVNYWYDRLTLPAGAKLVLHGHYPAARYFALATYTSNSVAGQGALTDSIRDDQVVPDKGSANPFLPGAARAGANGGTWSVTVTGDAPPKDSAARKANTLYAGTLATEQAQPVELLYRVYVPNQHFDVAGGGGLPEPTLDLADGTALTGGAACHAVNVDTTPFAVRAIPASTYDSLTHLPADAAKGYPGSGPNAPAVNPGEWYRLINPCHYSDEYNRSAGYALPRCPDTTLGLTFWPNPDNAYVKTSINRNFGPQPGGHNVLVVTGTMPTTPRTYRGDPRFIGGTQLRYWSLCTAESGVTTKTTVTNGCAYDGQVPLDKQRHYTLVISTPEDRPSNANGRCGVTWLDWGAGDGAGNPAGGVLVLRNLVPDRSFTQAAQNVPAPGLPADVATKLGPYLPVLNYTSPADFQNRGCHPAAIQPEAPTADQ
jgi:hypothetical protein